MNMPWWYHFAVLGKSASVAIGAFAGVAALVPIPAVQIGAAVIGGISTIVASYASKGVAVVQGGADQTK